MPDTFNRTLGRGLDMLELLAAHAEGLALSQLARMLELPRSSALNLARTLEEKGYALRDGESGRYRLSLKLFEVGSAAVRDLDVAALCRQAMARVHAELNETMHLGLRSGREVVYIDKMESTRSIRMTSHVGARMPLSATAMGKAILASLADGQVRALYAQEPPEALTARTVSDLPRLIDQLAGVRARGWAEEREESNEGVCCAGVAVRERTGEALYAISVSAPMFRAGDRELEEYGRALLRARDSIERAIGAV